MQVDNTLNSMMQLTDRLNKSANELAKLNNASDETYKQNQQTSKQEEDQAQEQLPDLTKEMLEQIQIPIAYNANAEVIATRDSTTQTLLDIKA